MGYFHWFECDWRFKLFRNAASCRLYLFTLPEDLELYQYRYKNITCRMNKIFFPLFRSLNKLQRTPHAISYTVSWDTHFPFLFGNCLGVPAASAQCQTLPVLISPLLVVIASVILPLSDRHCYFWGARLNWKSRVWNVAKRCVVSCMPATGISPVFLPSYHQSVQVNVRPGHILVLRTTDLTPWRNPWEADWRSTP